MRDWLLRYAGFLTVAVEIGGLLLCMLVHPLDPHQPGSQYGYYSDTRVLFGVLFTLASVLFFAFTLYIRRYWRQAPVLGFFGGVFLTLMAWVPYNPAVEAWVLDIHDISILISIICFTLVAGGLARQKINKHIADVSRVFFFILGIGSLASIFARALNIWLVGAQTLLIISCHVWIILVNHYAIRDEQVLAST